MRNVKIAGYTLLKNEAGYKRWAKGHRFDIATPPSSYPVFARMVWEKAKRVPHYLTLPDVRGMRNQMLAAIKRAEHGEQVQKNIRSHKVSQNGEPENEEETGESKEETEPLRPYVVAPGPAHYRRESRAPVPPSIEGAGPFYRDGTAALARVAYSRGGHSHYLSIACKYEETEEDWLENMRRLGLVRLEGAVISSVRIEADADELRRKKLNPADFPTKQFFAPI